MKLFVETADPGEVRACFDQKLVEGVTTSLSVEDRALPELCACAAGPVSARVQSRDHQGMLSEARALARLGLHVVARLPLDVEGLKGARACADEGIPVHLAGCDSAVQAVLAAKAGARYVSPVVPSAEPPGNDGNELVRAVAAVLKTYRLSTEVLVASVRSASHIVDVALAGAAAAAVPLAVLQQVMKAPAASSGSLST